MMEEEKMVKIAYCTCGKAVLLVSTMPHGDNNPDTVADFKDLESEGHKVEIVTLEAFKEKPFYGIQDCDCYKMPEKMVTVSLKDYELMRKKADKWDALDKKINAVYYDEHGTEQMEDEGGDLCTIGEMAAIAFGYL